MTNEIVVETVLLTGTPTIAATLTAWHPYVDVYIDSSNDPVLIGSQWDVYGVSGAAGDETRVRLASQLVSSASGQRIIAKLPGIGTRIQLEAFSANGPSDPSSYQPIHAAIVGWDPTVDDSTPITDEDGSVILSPGVDTVIGSIAWRPSVDVLVDADDTADESLFSIRAVLAGFTSHVPVVAVAWTSSLLGKVVCRAEGGCTSWKLYGTSPKRVTAALSAAIFGHATVGAGVVPPTPIASEIEYTNGAPAFPGTVTQVQEAIDAAKQLIADLEAEIAALTAVDIAYSNGAPAFPGTVTQVQQAIDATKQLIVDLGAVIAALTAANIAYTNGAPAFPGTVTQLQQAVDAAKTLIASNAAAIAGLTASQVAYTNGAPALSGTNTLVQQAIDTIKGLLLNDPFTLAQTTIAWIGGSGASGGLRPGSNTVRNCVQTTNATITTLGTPITVTTGRLIRVISEVIARRTDVAGDAAWFVVRAVYLESGGALTAVKAPEVVDSSKTAGASAWLCVLDASGVTVRTRVTGEAAKTIKWSVVHEAIEDQT